MKLLKFEPYVEVIGNVQPTYSIEELAEEVGVYSASPEFVRDNCGLIANSILDEIPASYHEKAEELGLFINIDIRIHRLYPGVFPAYPGWHCDGEYRETYFGQPILDRIPTHNHLVCTVSSREGGISNTEYLLDSFELSLLDAPDEDFVLWRKINKEVESWFGKKTFKSQDGQLIRFDSKTLHRATPARCRGWRLFFRASMWHKPYLGGHGKISKQELVYMDTDFAGW